MGVQDGEFGDGLVSPVKWGTLDLIHIEATSDGAGALTIDAALSSPGTTITGGAGGLATIGFQACQFALALSAPIVVKADSVGEIGAFRTLVATTGVGTLEFWPSNTAGTATAVLSARIIINVLAGGF